MGNSLSYKAFTIDADTDDFSVLEEYPNMWVSTKYPKQLRIKTTADIVIKINSIDNDEIEVKSTDDYFEFVLSNITNVYITTTAEASIGLSLIG